MLTLSHFLACRARASIGLLLLAMLTPCVHAEDIKSTNAARVDSTRIVSVGGAVTEVLYALGVADRIVAVDATSLHPPVALKSKPNVGYLRALSAEGVLSLAPSLVIASDKAGPAEVVRSLKSSSIGYLEVDEEPTPAGLLARIGAIAEAVARVEEGRRLAGEIKSGFDRIGVLRATILAPRSALVVLSVQSGRLLAGGSGTSADGMLALAGVRNIAADFKGFKPMSAEAVLNANPDAIITMRYQSGAPVREAIEAMPGMMATSAARSGRIVEMDGLLLLGFGPRTPEAALALMKAIYGAAALADDTEGDAMSAGASIRSRARAVPPARALACGGGLLVVAALTSLAVGPTGMTFDALPHAIAGALGLADDAEARRQSLVLLQLRLPRTLLGMFVGAALAAAGVMMQSLFRNPLADPGLVGVSAGAALAAIATIALGNSLVDGWRANLGIYALPLSAFAGGLATTMALVWIASRRGTLAVGTLLLAGIAVAALAGSLSGLIAFGSDDRELRDLTLWSMGSMAGASWTKVIVVIPFALVLARLSRNMVRVLNGFLLGEAEAFHLGIDTERAKRTIVVATAASVGSAVAVAGIVAFVGLVVPHLVRQIAGPDHRVVLPGSMLLGAALVVLADVVARMAVRPAELPLGIVMALIGAPVLLHLVMRRGIGGLE